VAEGPGEDKIGRRLGVDDYMTLRGRKGFGTGSKWLPQCYRGRIVSAHNVMYLFYV